jgi:hypothetical protein
MAKIKVEGLGIIEIEGDVPTNQEIKAIENLLNTQVSDSILSIEEYKEQNPDSANVPDLELAEQLFKQNFEGKIDETKFYEKAFPKITAKKPKKDFVEPLPEAAALYLATRGINYDVSQDKEFKPTVEEIAERSNVSVQDPATYKARMVGSFGYNETEKQLGIKKVLSELHGSEVDVRIGPNTGELEYLNPKTKQYALVDKPGLEIADFADLQGDAFIIGADIVTTAVTTALAIPAGAGPAAPYFGISAGAIAAAAGEFYKLKKGQEYGINQGLTNDQLVKEGFKTGAFSLGGGTSGVVLGYIFKGVNNMLNGRSFHFKNADILQEEKVLEADQVQKQINETLEKNSESARLKFSLGKAADDPDLMATQSALEKTKRLNQVEDFRKFNREEADALNKYFGIIKKSFGTSNDTTFDSGKLIKKVVEKRQEKPIQDIIKKQENAEELLDKAIFKLPTGNEKITGQEFRSILNQLGDNYKTLVDDAAKQLDKAAGTKLINTDKIADSLKILSAKDQRSLVEVAKTEGVFKPGVYESLLEPNSKILISDVRETISVIGKLIRDKFQNKTTGETVDTGKLLKIQSSFFEQLKKDAGEGYMNELQGFNTLVKQNKELLDNDLMSKLTKIEVGNKYKIAEEDIFLQTFKSGTGSGKAAREVYDVISSSPDAMLAYKNSIFDFYKTKVFKDGVPNVTNHKSFMKAYDKPLRQFFNKTEYRKIAKIGGLKEYIEKQNKLFTNTEKELAKTFEGKILNTSPQEVFNKIYKINSIDEIRELKSILTKNPEVLQKFQRDVITDINERIMTQSDYLGIKVIDAKKLDTLLNGAGGERGFRAALTEALGKKYVDNLDILNKALKISSRRAPSTGVEGIIGNAFTDIIRAQVGQFTKAGRIFTAGRRLFKTAANRMIANALKNPKDLELLVSLRKYTTFSKATAAILAKLGGSIFLDSDEEIRTPVVEDDQVSSLLNEGEGADDVVQMASAPMKNTAPLAVPNIDPNLFAQAPTGIATLNQGLTPSESAFLREEDKQIRLRSRGLA